MFLEYGAVEAIINIDGMTDQVLVSHLQIADKFAVSDVRHRKVYNSK